MVASSCDFSAEASTPATAAPIPVNVLTGSPGGNWLTVSSRSSNARAGPLSTCTPGKPCWSAAPSNSLPLRNSTRQRLFPTSATRTTSVASMAQPYVAGPALQGVGLGADPCRVGLATRCGGIVRASLRAKSVDNANAADHFRQAWSNAETYSFAVGDRPAKASLSADAYAAGVPTREAAIGRASSHPAGESGLTEAIRPNVALLARLHTAITPSCAVSHVTAALLWSIPLPIYLEEEGNNGVIHVTRRHEIGRVKRRGVIGHRAPLLARDVRVVNGVQLTSPEWTWMDLARHMGTVFARGGRRLSVGSGESVVLDRGHAGSH